MPRLNKIEELRSFRAHMDAHLPDWREAMLARRGGDALCLELGFVDGTSVELVLYCRPEPVTVEFGGTEFGEFEPHPQP